MVKFSLKRLKQNNSIFQFSKKKSAIKLLPSDSNKVEIINQGTDFNNKEEQSIEKIIVPIETNKKVKSESQKTFY